MAPGPLQFGNGRSPRIRPDGGAHQRCSPTLRPRSGLPWCFHFEPARRAGVFGPPSNPRFAGLGINFASAAYRSRCSSAARPESAAAGGRAVPCWKSAAAEADPPRDRGRPRREPAVTGKDSGNQTARKWTDSRQADAFRRAAACAARGYCPVRLRRHSPARYHQFEFAVRPVRRSLPQCSGHKRPAGNHAGLQ